MRALAAFANEGSMLLEQVWDQSDLPEQLLFRGTSQARRSPAPWPTESRSLMRPSI